MRLKLPVCRHPTEVVSSWPEAENYAFNWKFFMFVALREIALIG
jgi:hypothetical protein